MERISYHQADERPPWQPHITENGVVVDYSSGYTFQVKIAASPTATALLTKTTNITGAAAGVVTVAWAPNELNIEPGIYYCQLIVTKASDSTNETEEVEIEIRPRL